MWARAGWVLVLRTRNRDDHQPSPGEDRPGSWGSRASQERRGKCSQERQWQR